MLGRSSFDASAFSSWLSNTSGLVAPDWPSIEKSLRCQVLSGGHLWPRIVGPRAPAGVHQAVPDGLGHA